MFLRKFNKRGSEGVTEVARWILYIGVLIAAGFGIASVIMGFG